MPDDLGIGLALELASFADQLIAQRLEILDDAVVHQRNRADDVGVGIADRRRTARTPAGVCDPNGAVQRIRRQLARKLIELSLGPAADEPAVIDRADARRIRTTIFEALESVEQPPRNIRSPDNPNNSAHTLTPRPFSSSALGSG